MVSGRLYGFIEQVSRNGYIDAGDVEQLRGLLDGGLSGRPEAEALLALDRAFNAHESWSSLLINSIVRLVVKGNRPAGFVTNDDVLWLTTILDVGAPSDTHLDIAYAILDEAAHVDSALVDFIMRARQQARMMTLAA